MSYLSAIFLFMQANYRYHVLPSLAQALARAFGCDRAIFKDFRSLDALG
jgi:hypothetical protein